MGATLFLVQESKQESVDDSKVRKLWGRENAGFHFVASIGRLGEMITLWDKEAVEVGDVKVGDFPLPLKCCLSQCHE